MPLRQAVSPSDQRLSLPQFGKPLAGVLLCIKVLCSQGAGRCHFSSGPAGGSEVSEPPPSTPRLSVEDAGLAVAPGLVCGAPGAAARHAGRGLHVAGACCPWGASDVQGRSWRNDVLTASVPLILQVSGQAWRSSSFSCSLCWVLPEHIGMMLRFASTLDLPANQGMGGPARPGCKHRNSVAALTQYCLLPTPHPLMRGRPAGGLD